MKRCHVLMLSVLVIVLTGAFASASGDPIGDWIGRAKIDAKAQAELAASWNEAASSAPVEKFDRFGRIAARLDKRIGYFAGLKPEEWPTIDHKQMEADLDSYPPVVRDNLRLWVARKLIHASLYDEAVTQLDEEKIDEDAVLDKMSLYFYRAASAYRKMDQAGTAKWVEKLNECEKNEGLTLSERYKVIARLMVEDLSGLDKESLDYIARQMEDITRRLDLGRSGKKVQDKEDEVIKALEKMIKNIEDQQQKDGGSNPKPENPREKEGGDLPKLNTEGEIDPKPMETNGNGWGNLPEKDRIKVLNDLERRFPGHYREVIEEYFRCIAKEK